MTTSAAASSAVQWSFGNSEKEYHAYIQQGPRGTLPEWVAHDRGSFWAYPSQMPGTHQISFGLDKETWHAWIGETDQTPWWAQRNTGTFWVYSAQRDLTESFCQGRCSKTHHSFMMKASSTSELPAWASIGRFCFWAYTSPPPTSVDNSINVNGNGNDVNSVDNSVRTTVTGNGNTVTVDTSSLVVECNDYSTKTCRNRQTGGTIRSGRNSGAGQLQAQACTQKLLDFSSSADGQRCITNGASSAAAKTVATVACICVLRLWFRPQFFF